MTKFSPVNFIRVLTNLKWWNFPRQSLPSLRYFLYLSDYPHSSFFFSTFATTSFYSTAIMVLTLNNETMMKQTWLWWCGWKPTSWKGYRIGRITSQTVWLLNNLAKIVEWLILHALWFTEKSKKKDFKQENKVTISF